MKRKLHNPVSPQKMLVQLLAVALFIVTTGVNAQITTFPWTETFEDSSPSRPAWTQIYESGTMAWTFATDASTGSYNLDPYQGSKVANFPANSWNSEKTKLVSPVLNLEGATNTTLSFYYVNPSWGSDQNVLRVFYRTSAASAWTQISILNTNVSAWTSSGTITLPNPTATYQIALEGHTFYGYSIMVDQLVVNATISTVGVTGVDVATQGSVAPEILTASGSLQLTATVNPATASQEVTWSVTSGSAFASVNSSGLVTAIANGSAVIRATSVADPTKFDEITITINMSVPVQSVTVNTENNVPAEITSVAGVLQLEAVVNPAGANQTVTWSVVSGSAFASVNAQGLVTAIADGTVTVRATSVADPTKFDEITITIDAIIEVETVTINTQGNVAAEITTPGGTLQLEAIINPLGADQDVTWSVTNGSAYATVSATGLVTATADGTVTVRATSVTDPTKLDEIDIVIDTVIEIESLTVVTENNVAAEITTLGGTLQLEAIIVPTGASQNVTWSVTNGAGFASVSSTGLVSALANGTATVRATSTEDVSKFDDIDVVIIGQTLGIDSFIANSVKVYPNPATGTTYIKGSDQIRSIELYSIIGQQLLSKAVYEFDASLDMSSFSAGNYILKINFEGSSKTVKLVKQ